MFLTQPRRVFFLGGGGLNRKNMYLGEGQESML